METCQISTQFSSDDAESSISYLKNYLETILRNWAKSYSTWNGPKRQAILDELFDRLEALEALS